MHYHQCFFCDLMQNVLLQVGQFNGMGRELDCVGVMGEGLFGVGVEGVVPW